MRRVGFDSKVITVATPLSRPTLLIVLRHSALMLDTVHTTAIEQRLPRFFLRLQQHLGASLYGAALDSTFARGGSRNLIDMLTIDRHMGMLMRRPNCLPAVAFVDGIRVAGQLEPSDTTPKRSGFGVPLGTSSMPAKPPFPAMLEMYISQKEVAAIEVFDSPDFVNEPFLDHNEFPTASCRPIVLIWSKYYQQPKWAGH